MTAVLNEPATPTANIDTRAAAEWLETVFPDGTPGLMHISSKGNWTGRTFPVADRDAAVRYMASQDRREGIYLRATTLKGQPREGGRGEATDTCAFTALWADIDINGPGHKHELCAADCPKGHTHRTLPLPPDVESAQHIITASGLPTPTLWVHSGGGLYPWWLLNRATLVDDDNRDELAAMSAQWQHVIGRSAQKLGWAYGAGVGDLPRILRVPGTINRKEGLARPCRIIETGGTAYTLDDLRAGLAAGQAAHPEPTITRPRTVTSAPVQRRSTIGAVTPNDDFEARVGWDHELLLGGAGWEIVKGTPGGYCEWVRPGKRGIDGLSATTGHDPGRDRLKVFTDATEFQQGGVYTKPGAYAVLHHGGNGSTSNSNATRELARLGYGTPLERSAPTITAPAEQPAEVTAAAPNPADFVTSLADLDEDARLQRIHELAVTLVGGNALEQQRYRNAIINAKYIGRSDWQSMLTDAKKEVERRRKNKPNATQDSPYLVVDGQTCYVDRDHNIVPLASFVPRVIAEAIRDDGTEVTRHVRVELRHQSGRTVEIDVPAADLPKARSWSMRALGPAAVINPMSRDEAHVATCAQMFGENRWESRTEYTHTGWRYIDDTWRFLTASGAIGAAGLDPSITVDLGNTRLNGYSLPDPGSASPQAIGAAIRASLDILNIAPEAITAIMLAAAYRAPLPVAPETSVFVAGPSGSLKTAVSALAAQHFGSALDPKGLPAEWKSTANAIEGIAYQLDGVLMVIDDYAPQAVDDPRKLAVAADRIFRGSANASGRSRMAPDGTMRPVKHPRAQILSTGEDVPPGESLRARLTIAMVERGNINTQRLTDAQRVAADGTYALAMAGYVQWLADRRDNGEDLAVVLRAKMDNFRSDLATENGHRRAPEAAAGLLVAWRTWLEYATWAGAITKDEATATWYRVRAAMVEGIARQAEHTNAMKVEEIYLTALSTALASGKAHLADHKTMREPDDNLSPAHWGWAPHESPEVHAWRPVGELIGWVDGSKGCVYLHPEAAYAVAVTHARRSQIPLNASKAAVHQHLEQAGCLVSVTQKDGKTKQVTVTKRIGGTAQKVLHVLPELITGDQGGADGEE